jgi:hypothetical protein
VDCTRLALTAAIVVVVGFQVSASDENRSPHKS